MKKKKYLTILFFVIITIFGFGINFANYGIAFAQDSLYPTITSVDPSPFSEGDKITIYGENFGGCSIDNEILINEKKLYLSDDTYCNNWTNNKIIFDTLIGIQSGPLQIRDYKGQGSNTIDIAVNPKNPTISSISPREVYPGSVITIAGNDFGSDPCDGAYQFFLNGGHLNYGNVGCSNWDNQSLEIYIPKETKPGINELQILLSNGIADQRYSNKINFTVLDPCTQDKWECGEWNECPANGKIQRTCSKIFDCPSTETASPAIIQSCTYTPPCTQDTWQCGNWEACSPQGTQARSCSKVFDCPSAETASPATSQYCVAPNQPKQQSPTEDLGIVNQDSIVKSTVKLICPVDKTTASQGSGTIIDSSGMILTNQHVIKGTPGCLVGFIDNYGDEPYFGDRQIADIYRVSSDADVAILKLRNPTNKNLTHINLSNGNSNQLGLGDKITTYGYPAKFGTKITYTSGDFSGVEGNYLKTTAIIEHGNSGGGAYLKNGSFVGIPSAVVKGDLNSLGFLLSVNKVKSWINGSSYAYDSGNSNNYSRVSSVLEDIDLSSLGSLNLYVVNDGTGQSNSTASKNNETVEKNLLNRLKGYILLQVESHGEAWYVDPVTAKRYYMKDGPTAYKMMRSFGLGMNESDYVKIASGDASIKNRLKGRIVLRVEEHGEAYWIDPKDLSVRYLQNGDEAYRIMRLYSLGITNANLEKVEAGDLASTE